jgi:hypothetical protein
MASLKLFLSKKMFYFNPLIGLTGMVVAFYSGFLVKMVAQTWDESANYQALGGKTSPSLMHALYCMTVFGSAEMIGGVATGRILQAIGKRKAIFILFGISVFSIAFSMLALLKVSDDIFIFRMYMEYGLLLLSFGVCLTLFHKLW